MGDNCLKVLFPRETGADSGAVGYSGVEAGRLLSAFECRRDGRREK